MKRNGFTVIEALVVVAIIAILLGICLSAGNGCQSYSQSTEVTGTYQCVKTYTVNVSENKSSKRVDMRPADDGPVQTFECDDSYWAGVNNSATLYGQFEPGRSYSVTTRGKRKEGYFALFPLVIRVTEIKK